MGWAFNGSRRRFLKALASMPAVTALNATAATASIAESSEPKFAYVGSPDRIDVFSVSPSCWTLKQSIPSRRPASLVLLPEEKLLFAINEVDEYLGLPSGSVESYAVAPGSGMLSLVDRQPLSLSATEPRHLAVAPNGQYLVVAAYGGGAYNLLPISGDGELGPVTQVLKEIGGSAGSVGQASAHPHSIAVHPSGKFFVSTDFGSDRINVFAAESGLMKRVCRAAVQPGDGPAHIAIHPSGSLLFISNALSRSVASYRLNTCTGQITDPKIRVMGSGGDLAVDPCGRFLYSTHPASSETLAVWTIDEGTGKLSMSHSINTGPHSSLLLSRDGQKVFLFAGEQGCSATCLAIDSTSGRLHPPVTLAHMQAPLCLALLYS